MLEKPHIFHLPTELFSQTLSYLPTRSLLKFSQTCRQAHYIATNNVSTLSLGIVPLTSSAYCTKSPPQSTSPTPSPPFEVWLRIPKAHTYDHTTLINFQSALLHSVITRHGIMLRKLEISVWAFTVGMAEVIADLGALRDLHITIDNGIGNADGYSAPGYTISRRQAAFERVEQSKAWKLLSQSAVWRSRLRTLKLRNVEVGVEHLSSMLGDSRMCKELQLNGCGFLQRELWLFLRAWKGRTALRQLRLGECGGVLGVDAFAAVGELRGLEDLELSDCQAVDSETFKLYNRVLWRIPNFTPPKNVCDGRDTVLEVDPDYVQ